MRTDEQLSSNDNWLDSNKTKYTIGKIDKANLSTLLSFKTNHPQIKITVVSIANDCVKDLLRLLLTTGVDEIIFLRTTNLA